MVGFGQFYDGYYSLHEAVNAPAEDEARRKVMALGQQDGNEHMVAVSKDGEVFATTSGEKRRLVVPSEHWPILSNPQSGLSVHHNHPADKVSFSPADLIFFARARGVKTFWAHAWKLSFRIDRLAPSDKITPKVIANLTDRYDGAAGQKFLKKEANITDIENNRPHYILRELHKKRMLNYSTDYGSSQDIDDFIKGIFK